MKLVVTKVSERLREGWGKDAARELLHWGDKSVHTVYAMKKPRGRSVAAEEEQMVRSAVDCISAWTKIGEDLCTDGLTIQTIANASRSSGRRPRRDWRGC